MRLRFIFLCCCCCLTVSFCTEYRKLKTYISLSYEMIIMNLNLYIKIFLKSHSTLWRQQSWRNLWCLFLALTSVWYVLNMSIIYKRKSECLGKMSWKYNYTNHVQAVERKHYIYSFVFYLCYKSYHWKTITVRQISSTVHIFIKCYLIITKIIKYHINISLFSYHSFIICSKVVYKCFLKNLHLCNNTHVKTNTNA